MLRVRTLHAGDCHAPFVRDVGDCIRSAVAAAVRIQCRSARSAANDRTAAEGQHDYDARIRGGINDKEETKKSKKQQQSSLDSLEGYRAAYTMIYDNHDYAAALRSCAHSSLTATRTLRT